MTKNEIARNTNKTIKGIARTIALDHKAKHEIGQILTYEEKEVLVPAGTRFEIIDVASDSDYEEMGYYEIKVKRI
jgi:hypothetical protein